MGSFRVPAASSEDEIRSVQAKLYTLKLIPSADSITPGTLDAVTLTAIADFQQLMNANFGAALPLIDPANPDLVVDSETLAMLQQYTPDMRESAGERRRGRGFWRGGCSFRKKNTLPAPRPRKPLWLTLSSCFCGFPVVGKPQREVFAEGDPLRRRTEGKKEALEPLPIRTFSLSHASRQGAPLCACHHGKRAKAPNSGQLKAVFFLKRGESRGEKNFFFFREKKKFLSPLA